MDSKSNPAALIPGNALQAQTAGGTNMDLASTITVTLQDSNVHFAFRCPGTAGLGEKCTCDWLSIDHKSGLFCSV